MAYCPKCGARADAAAAHCVACGAAVPQLPGVTYETRGAPTAPAHVTYYGPHEDLGRPIQQGTAIVALILNILIWPGLGSIIAGEMIGWIQGFLNLFGLVLLLTIVGAPVGIPLMIGMWIWGIVTGVQLINRAGAQERARLAAPR